MNDPFLSLCPLPGLSPCIVIHNPPDPPRPCLEFSSQSLPLPRGLTGQERHVVLPRDQETHTLISRPSLLYLHHCYILHHFYNFVCIWVGCFCVCIWASIMVNSNNKYVQVLVLSGKGMPVSLRKLPFCCWQCVLTTNMLTSCGLRI